MTVILDQAQPEGGVRILILGGGTYPSAGPGAVKVPVLDDISSATESALAFARGALGPWRDMFARPLASVDLLVNAPGAPAGAEFSAPGFPPKVMEPPTLANIQAARGRWLAGAGPEDVLVFYCCGHGIWLPSVGRTFLAADFGADPELPWVCAVNLDDFRLALGEKPPRTQWLIFDCCANTPTEAMKAINPNPTPLLTPTIGGRAAAEAQWGPLAQVRVASSTAGALAFGKDQRPSRFMEAFADACADAGFQAQGDDGRWWVDPAGLDKAIGTYGLRVAAVEDQAYYTFPRVMETDASDPPGLLVRDKPAACTLLVQSLPGIKLKLGDLTITAQGAPAGGQKGGPQAVTPYRHQATPFLNYRIELAADGQTTPKDLFALPPLAKTVF